MNILAIGDIVGEIGVKKIVKDLPKIKQENNIDFTVINAENSAGGMGITKKIFDSLLNAGCRCNNDGKSYLGKERYICFYR